MPGTLESLLIIALITAPGYIALQLFGRFSPVRRETSDLKILLPAVAAGAALHLLAAPWTLRLIDIYQSPDDPKEQIDAIRDHAGELMLWGILVLFALPTVLGLMAGILQKTRPVDWVLDQIGAGYVDRIPTAWEYVNRQNQPGFVRVHLTDGTLVGGRYSTNSFAGDQIDEDGQTDLYIEDQWFLTPEGEFIASIPHNWGTWLAASQIARIDYFDEGDEPGDATDQAVQEVRDGTSRHPATPTADPAEAAGTRVGQQQAGSPAQVDGRDEPAQGHRQPRARQHDYKFGFRDELVLRARNWAQDWWADFGPRRDY